LAGCWRFGANMSTLLRLTRSRPVSPSLDAWLFLLLVGGYAVGLALRFADTRAGTIVVLLAAAAIGAYLIIGDYRARLLLAITAIAAIAIAPAILEIYLRHITAPYEFVHDGLIQTEEAIKFWLAGTNPYAVDYFSTPLAWWGYAGPDAPPNPALYHFAYMPFLILFSTPWYLIVHNSIGWFDERMVYVPLFLVELVLLSRLGKTADRRLALLLAVALNPLFVPYFAEGRNDVFILSWLVLCAALLQARHSLWAMVALAFACATKSTAWLSVPFFLIYALAEPIAAAWASRDYVSLVRRVFPLVAVLALVWSALILPFALWNLNAFVDSIFLYPVGRGDHGYPIVGVGLGGLGVALGWIPSQVSPFPFEQLQLLFGLPALSILIWFQCKRNTLSSLWLCCGLFTLLLGFFSHVFNDNHLGFVLSLLAIGILSNAERVAAVQTESMRPGSYVADEI
jgi:hypothetical protein